MARILFVAPYPISRIRTRSYGFVSQLAKEHAITVLALCSGERDVSDMEALQREGIAITKIEEKRFQQYLRSLSVFGTKTPFQVAFGAAPGLQAAIREQLEAQHFDLIHIEFIRALGALPDSLSIPVVWDAVDCISQLYEQGARFGATSMMRFIGQYEARRIKEYEYTQIRRFRHVLVTSERDRRALLEQAIGSGAVNGKPTAKIDVIPHGIDQQYFQQHSGPRQRELLIFSGKMSFHANVAGAVNLVKHVMPHIWKQRPHVQLTIAGSNPPLKVRQFARDPRIKVTGYVPDLRPYIAQAQVAVSPLPYAVGIQNKVLEAMAMGTPVVASSSASAGLHVTHGNELFIADDPEAFAADVLRLLDDQAEWNKLMEGGLRYIATYHNWETVLKQLNAVYTQTMDEESANETVII